MPKKYLIMIERRYNATIIKIKKKKQKEKREEAREEEGKREERGNNQKGILTSLAIKECRLWLFAFMNMTIVFMINEDENVGKEEVFISE